MSEWKCYSCEKEIKRTDEYIKDEDERYCTDCYTADTVTNYFIGGEFVGTTDDIEVFDSWDLEGADE